MEIIEDEQHRVVKKCKKEMLAAWLRGEDSAKEQTWSTLVDALRLMEKIALAQQIEKNTM